MTITTIYRIYTRVPIYQCKAKITFYFISASVHSSVTILLWPSTYCPKKQHKYSDKKTGSYKTHVHFTLKMLCMVVVHILHIRVKLMHNVQKLFKLVKLETLHNTHIKL